MARQAPEQLLGSRVNNDCRATTWPDFGRETLVRPAYALRACPREESPQIQRHDGPRSLDIRGHVSRPTLPGTAPYRVLRQLRRSRQLAFVVSQQRGVPRAASYS